MRFEKAKSHMHKSRWHEPYWFPLCTPWAYWVNSSMQLFAFPHSLWALHTRHQVSPLIEHCPYGKLVGCLINLINTLSSIIKLTKHKTVVFVGPVFVLVKRWTFHHVDQLSVSLRVSISSRLVVSCLSSRRIRRDRSRLLVDLTDNVDVNVHLCFKHHEMMLTVNCNR